MRYCMDRAWFFFASQLYRLTLKQSMLVVVIHFVVVSSLKRDRSRLTSRS